MMFSRRHWIPPAGLIFAQLSHGASWWILVFVGLGGSLVSVDSLALAWVHTVALGWATVAAISVLFHVIPAFTDARWNRQSLARVCLFFFCIGVVMFVLALLVAQRLAFCGATVTISALLLYSGVAFTTLGSALRGQRTERAIARALIITLVFLDAAAIIGFALAALISGIELPSWVRVLPGTHAVLGLFGWLSLLIFGVSARTVRPITGNKSRFAGAHIAVGTCTLVGVPLLAIGLLQMLWLAWAGAIIFGCGAVIYALDAIDIMRRATVSHRPPQAFFVAATIWLLCGLGLGAATLAGRSWSLSFGFVVLAGWVGQMINAHIHHIGVRLLLTVHRGEADETRPEVVLTSSLSWTSFAAFQFAVAVVTVGLLRNSGISVFIGAVAGGLGWFTMAANLLVARQKARQYLAAT
ncbi:MAG: hypothetical protein GIW98_01930 [Candidatus Eremiobacteraeota bacterium]|nr:hypothetical protein [Candidatus Eremiobacteraeota bacterium]